MAAIASLNLAAVILNGAPPFRPRALFDKIKNETRRSTVPEFKDSLDHLKWLQDKNIAINTFSNTPELKIRQFAAEARSLDDVANMFVRQIKKYTTKQMML